MQRIGFEDYCTEDMAYIGEGTAVQGRKTQIDVRKELKAEGTSTEGTKEDGKRAERI